MFTKQSSKVKLVRYETGSGKLLLVVLAGLALRFPESLCSHSVLRMCPVRELMFFSIFQIGKLRPSEFYSSIMIKYRKINIRITTPIFHAHFHYVRVSISKTF